MIGRRRMLRGQHGFALVATLFLLIVVAALGLFAMRSGIAQQGAINTDLLRARVDAAARSGLEYGSARAMAGSCAALESLVIAGIDVAVRCTTDSPAHPLQVYDLTVTAQVGAYGSPDFARRTLSRRVRLGLIG